MTKGTILTSVILLAGTIGGCGGGPLGIAEHLELVEAQRRWSTSGLHDYDFEMRRLCFCSPDYVQWSRVEVRAGTVVAVRLLTDGTAVPVSRLDEWPTIVTLFRRIREARRPYEMISAVYDPVLGYPISISFEPEDGIADAGVRYELRALVAAR
jgi:hypothetical protein